MSACFIVADATGAELPELFENQQHTAYVNLSSDHELDQVLGYVVTQYPDHIIRYITKATDLQEGGLETRIFPDDQGNISSPHPGMMFTDRAVMLVVDYRQMTASQMAELNGMLDSVRTYNGNALSNTTRVLAVVDESVLSGSWSPDAPGSDFWRRVNNIKQSLDISLLQNQGNDCLLTLDQYVNRHVWEGIPFDVSHLATKTLDFAAGLPATDVLSGGIELDSEGGLAFRDAALGESGDTLFILKDAPWQDVAFKVQLANALASRGVDSGDRCLALPSRFFLLKKDTSTEEMALILETFGNRHRNTQPRWFPINSVNFDLIFSGMTLHKGQLVKSAAVGNLKQDFEGIEVTSTLTKHQWQRLTGLLSDGGQLRNLALRVQEKKQPFQVSGSLLQSQKEAVNGSQVQRLSGTWSLEKLQENYPGAHIEVISPSLDASELLETIRMESRQQRRFQQHPTAFYKALQSPGQKVIITGLESNPGIQKLLESLLSGTPSVPGFGKLSPIHSQADIWIQWLKPELAATTYWSNWLSQTSGLADEGHDTAGLPLPEPVHVNWDNPKQLVATVREAIQNHALVYLEGPPGSGKSYTANFVAKSLAGQQTVYQLTTGPASRREDLFGEQALRPVPDRPNDYETRFAEGRILQWAQQRSKNGEPVVLILDEGNLLDKNLQVLLSGVTLKQPFISSNGDVYFLTPEHRLVITGNPLSFKGRHLIPELHSHAKTIQFAVMDSAGLSGQVIRPFLAAMDPQRCSLDQCDWIADLVLESMTGYQKQLPDYPFSARDTLDVLSRFQFYLGDLTQKTVHEIENTLKQALYDSFSGQLAKPKPFAGLSSRAWYVKHHGFDAFYEQLKQQPTSLHFDNDSTRALARRIWLELERIAVENNHQQNHPGRHGMMIEGPAGRGKDVVLDIVIKQWQKNWAHQGHILPAPLRITAGFNNWDTLKAMIIQAKREGRILIVSELNLLPTHFLEGVLNDVLAGEAAPGFFLFATVNPVQYSGRHAFSSALASRFTQLILDEYTLEDFKAIAASYTDSPFADDIALWHHERVRTLKNGKALAVPAVMVMIDYLKVLDKSEMTDPNALRNRFMASYRLYLKDGWRPKPIAVPLEADIEIFFEKEKEKEKASLPDVSPKANVSGPFDDKPETKKIKKETTENQTSSHSNTIQDKPDEKAMPEASGIPEEPQKSVKASPDIVGHSSQATTQNDAAKVVTDDKPKEKASNNQPLSYLSYLSYLKKVSAAVGKVLSNGLQAAKEYMPVDPGYYLPEMIADNALDGRFNQEQSLRLNKRFTSDFPPPFYRIDIRKMKIHDNGKVELVPFPAGELTLYQPASLQTDLSRSLKRGQHHGIQDVYYRESLTSLFPHETLVGIWTEENRNQPIEVQYDALRGVYTVHLPEAGYFSKTRLHYVVEEDKANREAGSLAPVEAYQAPLVWIEKLSRLLKEKKELAKELGHNKNLSQKQRVRSIIAYVKRFTTPPTGVSSLDSEESNIEMLAELIERRIGTCRHIAFAAAGLMQFYGIPVRVMGSETHAWVEYSLNNGKTWLTSETWGTYGEAENPEDFGDRTLISNHDDLREAAKQKTPPLSFPRRRESTTTVDPRLRGDGDGMFLPATTLRPDTTENAEAEAAFMEQKSSEAKIEEVRQAPIAVKKKDYSSHDTTVIQQLFYHEHSVGNYRQSVQYMEIDDNGDVQLVDLPYRGIRIPALPTDVDGEQLSNHDAMGGEQAIKTGIRTALASLSPQETLLALWFEGIASTPYLLEYDPFQNLYFITVNKEEGVAEDITLRFLIQPNELPFPREALVPDKQKPGLMSERLRKQVDVFFADHPVLREHIGIKPELSRSDKIKKIGDFLNHFSLINYSSSGVSLKSLLQQIERCVGIERGVTGVWDGINRSFIVAMLAEYYNAGIARVVSNDVNTFVELSVDGGAHWQSYYMQDDEFHKYEQKAVGTELLKTGWDSLQELPSVKRDRYFDEELSEKPMLFIEQRATERILRDLYYLKGESRRKALSYYKNLLFRFKVHPSRMKDIPYFLLDDPEVRQKLLPWLNEQIRRLMVSPSYMNNHSHTVKMNVINPQLNGSPFAELGLLVKRKSSTFKTVWKYQPPGRLQVNRLLENKASFAHTSEHRELQSNRSVIFNVGESPLLDQEKWAHYQTILLHKLGKDKVNSMDSETKKQLVEQSLFDATYHLSRLVGQKLGVLQRRLTDVGVGGRDTYGLLLFELDERTAPQDFKWLWTQTFHQNECWSFRGAPHRCPELQTSIPLQANQLPDKWQDAVIIDGDMLDRLSTRYLESLSSEQVENIRKAILPKQATYTELPKLEKYTDEGEIDITSPSD